MFVRIKETVAEKLRGLCAGLSPEKRMLTVIVLAVLFALGNFYLIFRAIYDIGREDVQRDIIEIAPLDIPDIVPADTLPDKRVQEMEEFFNRFSSSVRCGSFSHRPKRTNKRRRKMRASTPNCLTREEPT